MKCEIIRNDMKIAGPMTFDPQEVKAIIARQGANANLVPPNLTSAVKISTIVIKPVKEIRPNLTAAQRYGAATRSENDYEVTYTYDVVTKTDEEMRSNLLKRLSAVHDDYEATRFDHRGVLIKADLEARINAKATVDLFREGILTSGEWRGKLPNAATTDPFMDLGKSLENGRIPMTSTADAEGIYGAIVNYLGKGFAARSMVETELAALSGADLVGYDVKGKFTAITSA